MANGRGITLVEVMVVVVAAAVVLSLLLPSFAQVSRRARVSACADNLRALHAAQQAYAAKHGAPPPGQGKTCWRKLRADGLVDGARLRCPLAEARPNEDCSYYGPAGSVATFKDDAPLGCDQPLNHRPDGREGNVLLKSGRVRTDDRDLWREASRGQACRP